MFDYNKFKEDMQSRGHEVKKKGDYITVEPNNNYLGYAKGFLYGTDVVQGWENFLKLIGMDHFNTWIYSIRFKLV